MLGDAEHQVSTAIQGYNHYNVIMTLVNAAK
jgi:hypothetical protein